MSGGTLSYLFLHVAVQDKFNLHAATLTTTVHETLKIPIRVINFIQHANINFGAVTTRVALLNITHDFYISISS